MLLAELPRLADQIPELDTLVTALTTPGATEAVALDGLTGPAKSFTLARLFARLDRPLLLITNQQDQAQRLWDDLIVDDCLATVGGYFVLR